MHIWEEPSLWDDLIFPQKEKSGRANRRTAVEAHTGFTHRHAAKDGGRGRESHARKSVDSAEPFPRLRSTDEGVDVPGEAGGGGPAGVSPSRPRGAACAGSRQATLSSRHALLIRVALRQRPEQQLRQKPPWEDRAQTGEDRTQTLGGSHADGGWGGPRADPGRTAAPSNAMKALLSARGDADGTTAGGPVALRGRHSPPLPRLPHASAGEKERKEEEGSSWRNCLYLGQKGAVPARPQGQALLLSLKMCRLTEPGGWGARASTGRGER